jgi:hypothetical protein
LKLTFQLPVPTQPLYPNFRGHWTTPAAAKRFARALARREGERVLCDAKIPPPRWKRAHYWATLFHLRPITPDPDNFCASLKAYLDGLADAGIFDNDRNVWPERPQFLRATRLPHVEITIEPE